MDENTHLEVEVKILNIDAEKIESFLKKEQARVIFDGEQEQWHYKRPEGGTRFRIRKETGSRNQFLVTIKTHNAKQTNEIKAENEEEFVVASKEEGEQLAKEKGFAFSHHICKYRKEYQLPNVQFCFDTGHTKVGDMPIYMEIESDREEIVFAWVHKLGFTKEDCVQKSARRLIEAFENQKGI